MDVNLKELGLYIEAGMTTPKRKGKQPRPVWTVSGEFKPYEHLFYDLGGKKFRGNWSFWEDPTTDIEEAIAKHGKLSFADRQEHKRERAANRAQRLTIRARKHRNIATNAYNAYRRIADFIPLGQPILIGHHSERRHRRDIERMRRNTRKQIDASNYANHLETRAAHNELKAEGQYGRIYCANRLEEVQTALRALDRDMQNPYYKNSLTRLENKKSDLLEQQQYWQQELEKIGFVATQETVKPGDFIQHRGGGWHKVQRANRKTVTVHDWLGTLHYNIPYSNITGHKSATPPELQAPKSGDSSQLSTLATEVVIMPEVVTAQAETAIATEVAESATEVAQKKITVNFIHTENEIPKGCRKPRDVEYTSTYTFNVAMPTPEQAPVAIVETLTLYKDEPPHTRQFRWFDNRLWVNEGLSSYAQLRNEKIEPIKSEYGHSTTASGCKEENEMPGSGRSYHNKAKRIEEFDKWANNRIIIDGETWTSCCDQEPRYYVSFSGYNREDEPEIYISRHYEYEDRHEADSYYRIDQADLALKQAEDLYDRLSDKIATRYPDAKPLAIRWAATYEVSIPEAVRLQPQQRAAQIKEECFQFALQQLSSEAANKFKKLPERMKALRLVLATTANSEVENLDEISELETTVNLGDRSVNVDAWGDVEESITLRLSGLDYDTARVITAFLKRRGQQ